MRVSIVIFLSVLALACAQDLLVEEETGASAGAAVVEEELDLDELLEEADVLNELLQEADEAIEEALAAADDEPETVVDDTLTETAQEAVADEAASTTTEQQQQQQQQQIEQSGPFVDLLGHQLYSLEMIDETQAQLVPQYTNDALKGKKVVGLYFSADWCGPCRKFTPELVAFYDKMNARRGQKDEFEIIWVSRCRDIQSFGQYFTHMKWLALPPEEAQGERGQWLSQKYKVKGIPHLALLDDAGNLITTDARNKIPTDKSGVGFPWRNPLATLYITIFPRALRMMVKGQVDAIKGKLVQRLKGLVGRS